MSNEETRLKIWNLKQRRERIVRRFWFQDRGILVCEFDAAIHAVAILSAQILTLTDRTEKAVAA